MKKSKMLWCAAKYISVMFTGYTLVWAAYMAGAGHWQAVWPVVSVLLTACLFGGMQWVCFGGQLLQRWSYLARWVLFVAVTFPGLGLLAWAFGWVPQEEAGAWAILYGAAIAILALCTLAFELFYHRQGKKYDGLLSQYHAKKNGKPQEGDEQQLM